MLPFVSVRPPCWRLRDVLDSYALQTIRQSKCTQRPNGMTCGPPRQGAATTSFGAPGQLCAPAEQCLCFEHN